MKQPITLQWINTCTTSNPTSISIQRCKNVNFNKPKANIEVIAQGVDDGLNPTLDTGWYIDNDIEHNESYSYRVVTHRDTQKVASVTTDFVYCVNFTNELGYAEGSPEKTSKYNINQTPVLHIDANRLTGSIVENNDVVMNAASLLRVNKHVECVNSFKDPIVDRCDKTNTKMVSKTQTPVNQNNVTQNIKHASIFYNVPDNIKYQQYTIFAVVYDHYNESSISNTYDIAPNHTVKWNQNDITFISTAGQRTIKRQSNTKHKLFMVRVDENHIQCWENMTLLYSKRHNKKTTCNWLKSKQYNLLPNHNNNYSSGLCEYILFDHSIDYHQCSIVSQYLTNRYTIEANILNIRDFNC